MEAPTRRHDTRIVSTAPLEHGRVALLGGCFEVDRQQLLVKLRPIHGKKGGVLY
jgi:hypothetical protein